MKASHRRFWVVDSNDEIYFFYSYQEANEYITSHNLSATILEKLADGKFNIAGSDLISNTPKTFKEQTQ